MRFALIIFISLLLGPIAAQDILSMHPGARGASMGSIKTVHTDVLAMYGNEAGLAYLSNLSVYVTAERRFSNEGLNFYTVAAALPTALGTFGTMVSYYGFDLYNEMMIGAAYARKLSTHLSLGAQFDYLQVQIPTYGRKSVMTAEVGILAKVSSRAQVGFQVYNPFDIQLNQEQSLPTSFALGVSYAPTDDVRVMAEIEKVTSQRENIKVGLEYFFIDQFALRLGVNTNPALVTFGVGYQLQSGLAIDLGSTVHQQLGISPIAGFGYQRTEKP